MLIFPTGLTGFTPAIDITSIESIDSDPGRPGLSSVRLVGQGSEYQRLRRTFADIDLISALQLVSGVDSQGTLKKLCQVRPCQLLRLFCLCYYLQFQVSFSLITQANQILGCNG